MAHQQGFFTDAFRANAEMKYQLMPYVYAQAKDCSEKGLPMVRALFVEFPHDAGAWLVEDEYMYGFPAAGGSAPGVGQ